MGWIYTNGPMDAGSSLVRCGIMAVWQSGSLGVWESGSLVRTVQSPPAAAARFGGRGRQETNDITQYLPQLEEAGFDGWWWPRAFIGSGDSNVSIHHK